MADITIIGAGKMGSGIAARAVAAGRSLQILDRTAEKAGELVGTLGVDAEVGVVGDAPTGTVVVLAVPFDGAKDLATAYGSALAGRTVIDICNPVDYTTFDSLVVAPGHLGGRGDRRSRRPGGARGQGLQHDVREHSADR